MDVKVDGRVELMSILFHLAGGKGYIARDTPYSRAVDAHFGPFSDHPAVVASRELRAEHGISFNAPIGLAVFLDTKTLQPIADLSKADELDERWKGVAIREYLDKVRAFAVDANVSAFFTSQRGYMDAVEKRMSATLVGEKIDEWFAAAMVHQPQATFLVVPGLLTGAWNYDATTHDRCGRQRVYQIVELEGLGDDGLPNPTNVTTELVAHEMAHSYVNPIIEKHEDVLGPAAQPLYDKAREAMEKQRYPLSKIMVEESLVRVIAGFCTRDRVGAQAASELLHRDVDHGFTWVIELAQWMGTQKSPLDIEAMVPALTKWFAAVGARA